MYVHDENYALAQEVKAEGDRGLAALLLQAVRRKRKNLELKARLLVANGGSAVGIELADQEECPTRYVAILNEPDGSGKGRVVNFQANGLHGHQVYASPEASLEEAIKEGYRWQVKILDDLAQRPAFHKGQKLVEIIYAFNTGRIDREAFDAAVQELDRVYGKECA